MASGFWWLRDPFRCLHAHALEQGSALAFVGFAEALFQRFTDGFSVNAVVSRILEQLVKRYAVAFLNRIVDTILKPCAVRFGNGVDVVQVGAIHFSDRLINWLRAKGE